MILQVSDPIINGAISANWVIGGFAVIIGFLLVAFMSNINRNNTDAMNAIKEEIKNIHKRVDKGEVEHDGLAKDHTNLTSRVLLVEAHQKTYADQIANMVVNKLYAISPPKKGEKYPHNEDL